jgi:hypothetical protein
MAVITNSLNTLSAAAIAERIPSCTFSSIIYTKVGKEVGRKPNKVTVGNDRVQQVFLLGFSYPNLCQRSLEVLAGLDLDAVLADWGGTYGGHPIDKAVLAQAVAEVGNSLALSRDGLNESTTDDSYEPLVVDGEPVRGGRVYVGNDPDKVGVLYVQGLLISSKVLVAGNPKPAHTYREPLTAAKEGVRRLLPVNRYVSYRLTKAQDYFIKVGGTAIVEHADEAFPVAGII